MKIEGTGSASGSGSISQRHGSATLKKTTEWNEKSTNTVLSYLTNKLGNPKFTFLLEVYL
jgi:hypothetical protein